MMQTKIWMECRVQLQMKLRLYSSALGEAESKRGAREGVARMGSGWESYKEEMEEAAAKEGGEGKGKETPEERRNRRRMEEEDSDEEGEIDE
jgi:hypothetical protein